MADQIGRITVPSVTPSGVFPLVSDYQFGRALAPEVYVHAFQSGNSKIEQRFLAGMGAKRFTVRKQAMHRKDLDALATFWRDNKGTVGAFTYHCPTENGGTEDYSCRFADNTLTFDVLSADVWRGGVTLLEIPDPATAPVYELTGTDTRLPRAADPDLRTALLSQVQEIIPLVHIKVASDPTVPEIYLSDRRCTIGGQLYLPRLLRFDNVQQTLGVSPDAASFIFGNADRVIAQLVNDCDMRMARLEFSLFHVATGIKIDLWAGDILRWGPTGGLEVTFEAGDPLSALTRYYPTREVSRTCWKPFKHPAVCPYVGGEAACGKSWENCKARGMQPYFGGIIAKPQGVSIRENANKQRVTSYSLVSDSIYGRAVPEIYTARKLAVDCLVAAGREESDYYDALGVIGEGPLAGVSGGIFDNGATSDGVEHWRLTWAVTAPADKKHAGYKIVLRPSSGADATIEPAGDQVAGPWWPIGAAETYTAYCVSRDAANRYNTIGAATPKVTGIVVQAQTTGKVKANRLDPNTYDTTVLGPGIGGKLTVVAVDLSKPKLGSYDQTLFDPTSGMFKLKLSSQFKSSNNWLELGNLYVGNNTVSMPAGIFAYKYDGYQNILQGWMGYNGGVVGVWGKEIYGGGTGPADAPFYLNSAGVLGMTNPQITLSRVDAGSGSTNKVVITTSTYDALYTGALGVLVQRLNGAIAEPYTWHVSRGIVIHAASSYQLGALVGVYDAAASAFHGEVTLYNNGGGAMTIWLNGKDGKGYFGKVTVATQGEFDLAGNYINVTSMTLTGYTPIKIQGATYYIAVYS